VTDPHSRILGPGYVAHHLRRARVFRRNGPRQERKPGGRPPVLSPQSAVTVSKASAAARIPWCHGCVAAVGLYAGYGSTLYSARLWCHLEGGTPPGAQRSYAGCRDRGPAGRVVASEFPGGVHFATEPPVRPGGRAVFDPELQFGRVCLLLREVAAGQLV
jgi:hypothetical protein